MESISIIDETIDPLYMSIPVPASRNFIDQIYEFNQKAGLLDKPYYDILESSFQIEEALEGFDLRKLWCKLNGFNDVTTEIALQTDQLTEKLTGKFLARTILHEYVTSDSSVSSLQKTYLTDVERLDKACDAIVFAVGSIAKLKLTPAQLNEAMSIVMNANLAKLGMPKDEHGKLMKPEGFVGPEVQLQALLDRRTL